MSTSRKRQHSRRHQTAQNKTAVVPSAPLQAPQRRSRHAPPTTACLDPQRAAGGESNLQQQPPRLEQPDQRHNTWESNKEHLTQQHRIIQPPGPGHLPKSHKEGVAGQTVTRDTPAGIPPPAPMPAHADDQGGQTRSATQPHQPGQRKDAGLDQQPAGGPEYPPDPHAMSLQVHHTGTGPPSLGPGIHRTRRTCGGTR